jgi:hypothetical protein
MTTSIQITKDRLRAIRLAVGIADETVRLQRGKVQFPDGSVESDFRGRKFSRHHLRRAA